MPPWDPLFGICSFLHHHGGGNAGERLKLVRQLEFASGLSRGCHGSRLQRVSHKSCLFSKSLELSIKPILDGLCVGKLESFVYVCVSSTKGCSTRADFAVSVLPKFLGVY
jgi:hypothetical protein